MKAAARPTSWRDSLHAYRWLVLITFTSLIRALASRALTVPDGGFLADQVGFGAMILCTPRREDAAPSARRQLTVDPFLQLRIRRGATFLAAVYSNESSQQGTAKGTKNGCTSDTQRA